MIVIVEGCVELSSYSELKKRSKREGARRTFEVGPV